MTQDEMVGWHGHEFELALGDSGGQGSLAWCSPQGHKESNTTEGQNNKNVRLHTHTHTLLFYLSGVCLENPD